MRTTGPKVTALCIKATVLLKKDTAYPAPLIPGALTPERSAVLDVLKASSSTIGPTEVQKQVRTESSLGSVKNMLRSLVQDGYAVRIGRAYGFATDFPAAVAVKRLRATLAVTALFADVDQAADELGVDLDVLKRTLATEHETVEDARAQEDRLHTLSGRLLGKTNLSEQWWESGEGPMIEEVSAAAPGPGLAASEFRGQPGTPTGPPTGYTRIPMVTIEPAASEEGNELDVEIEEVEGDTWMPDWWIFQEYGMSPERIRHVRVRGDSMLKTIQPGQLLVIGLIPPGHILADGHVYVFRGPTGVLIKRLYLEPDHVYVWSDNKKAPRYRVPLEVWSRDYRVAAVALQINQKL